MDRHLPRRQLETLSSDPDGVSDALAEGLDTLGVNDARRQIDLSLGTLTRMHLDRWRRGHLHLAKSRAVSHRPDGSAAQTPRAFSACT